MYGQIIGDNLGATVEFLAPDEIRGKFPNGVRELVGGGPFDVAPGQATDDSELALALARTIARCAGYSATDVHEAYLRWGRHFPPTSETPARLLSSPHSNPTREANPMGR